MTAELLRAQPWEVVIFATGAYPRELPVSSDFCETHTASDVLSGKYEVGDAPVIVGGGLGGCELALHLLRQKKKVTVLELAPEILAAGPGVPTMNRTMLIDLLTYEGCTIHTQASIQKWDGARVVISTPQGSITTKASDVITSVGYRSDSALYQACSGAPFIRYCVGDARNVRNIMYAIWDAYEVARSI